MQTLNRDIRILVVDDEEPIREVMKESLRDEGYTVDVAQNGQEGLEKINTFFPSIIFLDIWMPGEIDGLELLEKTRKFISDITFIIMSGHGTIETAVKATKLGAWDFIEKPLSIDKISILIKNILLYQQERNEKKALLVKLRRNISLVGNSQYMLDLKKAISKIAMNKDPVFILGDNGSGKELISENIHYLGLWASSPFIIFNCANVPDNFVELELFGCEKGALTGTFNTKKGKFELVDEGTLVLKEIDFLKEETQEKIFSAIKQKCFSRIDGDNLIPINFRLIVTSSNMSILNNKNLNEKNFQRFNLEDEIGNFKENFLEKYKSFFSEILLLPPLRERKEDIIPLIYHFGEQFAREGNYQKKNFSFQALDKLKDYTWPGNIRELRNFVERVYILTPGEYVDVYDLSFAGINFNDKQSFNFPNFREARAEFEKEYLLKKINENNGNISKTAESIGLERSYLHRKIKVYGIEI